MISSNAIYFLIASYLILVSSYLPNAYIMFMLQHLDLAEYIVQLQIKYETYSKPPPAGPTALNRDIADIEIPFAAPLCSCF